MQTGASTSSIALSWNPSTPGTYPIQGYKVYRNTVQVGNVNNTSFADTGLSPSTSYSYTVSAFDAAGNTSAQSATSTATTEAQQSGGGSGIVQGGGGGGSAYDLSINGGASETVTPSVALSLYGTEAYTMEVSNTSTFAGASWIPYVTTMPWMLNPTQGPESVYVQFATVKGTLIGNAEASINLVPEGTSSGNGNGSGTGAGTSNASLTAEITALQAQLAVLTAQAGQSNQGAGTGTNTTPPLYIFTRNLELHDKGADVTALQAFLITKNAGSAARILKAHGVTQTFGILTYNALVEYQRSVGIHATGYFGMMTRGKVNDYN
jgi:hypothetical protein